MLRAAAALLALIPTCAAAQSGDPTARGALRFEAHANGLQHPAYAAAPVQACAAPAPHDARERLVALAIQEWARFGYPLSRRASTTALGAALPHLARIKRGEPYSEADPLMLQAVGGYWAALAGVGAGDVADVGGYEIANANRQWVADAAAWRRNEGWETPWSAAFISWLMCEAGVEGFARSWAHRDYVDAAIADAAHPYRAREPDYLPAVGDLICASRAGYRLADIAQRREQLGGDGEMHCDLVVAVDAATGIIAAIGGNVDDGVRLVTYRFAYGRVRSPCAGAKLCPREEERVFAVLALEAAASGTSTDSARPPRAPPRLR